MARGRLPNAFHMASGHKRSAAGAGGNTVLIGDNICAMAAPACSCTTYMCKVMSGVGQGTAGPLNFVV